LLNSPFASASSPLFELLLQHLGFALQRLDLRLGRARRRGAPLRRRARTRRRQLVLRGRGGLLGPTPSRRLVRPRILYGSRLLGSLCRPGRQRRCRGVAVAPEDRIALLRRRLGRLSVGSRVLALFEAPLQHLADLLPARVGIPHRRRHLLAPVGTLRRRGFHLLDVLRDDLVEPLQLLISDNYFCQLTTTRFTGGFSRADGLCDGAERRAPAR
jgi:hypothetical protein